jgi:Uma2 family endonuclease
MKVHLPAAEAFFYPDIFMTCAADDTRQNDYKLSPRLVVEVTTEASGAFDRGRKFALYRQFESLQAYIIIDATYPAVDCFFVQNGLWMLYPFNAGETLQIPALALECDVNDIYQDIFAE